MILEPCTKSKYFPLNNSDPHPTSFDVAAQGRRNLLSHEWWMPRPGGTQAQQRFFGSRSETSLVELGKQCQTAISEGLMNLHHKSLKSYMFELVKKYYST